MATLPPSPLPAFARTLWALDEGLQRKIEHNYDFVYALLTDMSEEWRRFQVIIEDSISTETADNALMTFDIVNYTANAIDSTWTSEDYNAVRSWLLTFTSWLSGMMGSRHHFSQVRAYRMSWNPDWPGSSTEAKLSAFNDSGPPEFTASIVQAGTGVRNNAPQVACSVTEMTGMRRHWGRFYLPGINPDHLSANGGRWTPSFVNALVDNVEAFYRGLAGEEMYVVIPATTHDKQRVAALNQVTAIRVDDVPDTIRRRRFRHSTYAKTSPALSGTLLPSEPSETPSSSE